MGRSSGQRQQLGRMQIEQSTLEILGLLATILFALWHFDAMLERKIDSEVSRLLGRIDSQNDTRNNLIKEFSELRGEIRATCDRH